MLNSDWFIPGVIFGPIIIFGFLYFFTDLLSHFIDPYYKKFWEKQQFRLLTLDHRYDEFNLYICRGSYGVKLLSDRNEASQIEIHYRSNNGPSQPWATGNISIEHSAKKFDYCRLQLSDNHILFGRLWKP